uniref:ABC transporter ATP-binding protein n=1 Tax=Halomonas sp. DP5Y7-2 TaxID=2859076 RepID=UPI0021BD4D6E|nr:ABC transporter ATP-binding protein [Halomonas sp. DP5Y7-2]
MMAATTRPPSSATTPKASQAAYRQQPAIASGATAASASRHTDHASSGNAISLKGLAKRFGDTDVFANIDADIAHGEFITLLGPSGCGKSTLLRAIAGLTSLNAGQILVGDTDITHLPPQRRGVGMVFQHYALFPNMKVADNVAFGLRMQKVPSDERARRVEEVLRLVEMQDQAHKFPHQLSGGQCQRVALARSLVVEPRVLLMDEPLSALDARIRKHLRDQIREIQTSLGLTTLFVTHDQEEAMLMSDRVFLMHQGRILQQDSAEAIYTRPRDENAAGFMGHYCLLDAVEAAPLLGYRSKADRVALRPEALYLSVAGMPLGGEHPERVGPGVHGLVRRHRLLGNIVRYDIDCAGVSLTVDTLNRSARTLLPQGQQVTVHVDLDEVQELDT